MTKHIELKDIEQGMRIAPQLRAQAFAQAAKAIGRGLRHAARSVVAIFA